MKIKPRKPKPIKHDVNKLWLNINHFLFWAYYRRVPKHFQQYTVLDSIQNIVDNYEHACYCRDSAEKLNGEFCEMSVRDQQEISSLKIQMLGANPDMVEHLNKIFGLKYPTSRDN